MSSSQVTVLALAPFFIGVLAALSSRSVAARMPVVTATRLLTILALTVSTATGLLLYLSAFISVAELAPQLTFQHWSAARLRVSLPLPPAVGVIAGVIATMLLCSAAVRGLRIVNCTHTVSVAAALMQPACDNLVIIRDASAVAYAIPGRHSRIVVSTGMVSRLSATQRRALLAHEAAHLRHHHHRYVQLGKIAAAANPLMRPVSRAIDLCVERWADESAAREVGNRSTVAYALAAAALGPSGAPSGALAGAQSDVIERVQALLRPLPTVRAAGVLITACVATCWTATVLAIADIHGLMEVAEQVTRR